MDVNESEYCHECGEPIDECRCDLENEKTAELRFDDDSVMSFDDEDVLF